MVVTTFRLFFAVLCCSVFAGAEASAASARHFVGAYRILTPPPADGDQYLVVDNGTLLEIWTKYADSPLPPDLQQYKDEPTILAGFTNREFLILAFEAFSTILDRYLRIASGDSDLLELYRRDDGQFDSGTRWDGKVDRYLLAPPVPLLTTGALARKSLRLVNF